MQNTSNGGNQSNKDVAMDRRIQMPNLATQSKIHGNKGKSVASRYMNPPSRNPEAVRNQVGQKKLKSKK